MLSSMGFYFVIRGSDQLSRHIRTATNSMRALGQVSVEDAEKLDQLDARARHFFGSAAKWGVATMGLARGLKSLTKAYGDFELVMKRTELTMGLSASQNKALAQSFQDMAGKTEWGATNLAKGAKTLAQAGFSLKEVQSAIPVMADMMTVGEIKSGEASDLMIQTLRGFDIGTDKLRETMDQMTYVAMKTPMSLQAMVQGMQYGTRGAASFGASLQDMIITTGLIYPVVMKAGGSYQVFTRAMTRLAAPTGKAAELLEKMNVQLRDETGAKLKPWVMFDNTLKAVRKLDKAQQDLAMNTIFGFRGMSVAALEHAQALDFNDETHKGLIAAANALQSGMIKSSGYLSSQADALRDQWTKEVERAKATWDNFEIALGPGVIYVFRPLLRALSGIAQALVDLNKASNGAFGKFMGGVLAIATIGAAGRTMLMFGRGLATVMGANSLLRGGGPIPVPGLTPGGTVVTGVVAKQTLMSRFLPILRWGGPIAVIATAAYAIQKIVERGEEREKARRAKTAADKLLASAVNTLGSKGGLYESQAKGLKGTVHGTFLAGLSEYKAQLDHKGTKLKGVEIDVAAMEYIAKMRSDLPDLMGKLNMTDQQLAPIVIKALSSNISRGLEATTYRGQTAGVYGEFGELEGSLQYKRMLRDATPMGVRMHQRGVNEAEKRAGELDPFIKGQGLFANADRAYDKILKKSESKVAAVLGYMATFAGGLPDVPVELLARGADWANKSFWGGKAAESRAYLDKEGTEAMVNVPVPVPAGISEQSHMAARDAAMTELLNGNMSTLRHLDTQLAVMRKNPTPLLEAYLSIGEDQLVKLEGVLKQRDGGKFGPTKVGD